MQLTQLTGTSNHEASMQAAAAELQSLRSQNLALLEEVGTMQHRLEVVGVATRIGMWEYDFEQDHLWVSDELAALYGTTADQLTWPNFAARIHPDDVHHDLERPTPSFPFGEVNEFSLRVRHDDGNYRTIRSRSVTIGDDEVPRKKLGSHIDISGDHLIVLNDELAEANERLRQFSYVAAHDLRSPLRGIRQLVHFLLEDHSSDLPATATQMITRIDERAEKLDSIVRELLDYATVDRTEVRLERCDVGRLLRDIAQSADSRGKTISLELQVDEPVVVPASQLAGCVRNLIDNACKHHDRDSGLVQVTARTIGSELEITVTDDGPGIQADAHSRIFEPFYTTNDAEGTGIGLAHVRSSIERHGATLELRSRLGAGSSFEIRWPLADADVDA